MKFRIFKSGLTLFCGVLFPSVSFAATYVRNPATGNWATVAEWSDNGTGSFVVSTVLPGTSDTVILNQDTVTDVDTAIGAVGIVQISNTTGGTFLSTTLNINSGGSLEPTGLLTVGGNADTGTLNLHAGGTLTATGGIKLGADPSHSLNVMGGTVTSPVGLNLAGGQFNLSAGTVTLTDPSPGGATFNAIEPGSIGTLNVSGGSFIVAGATGASDTIAFRGEINLSGGTFSAVGGQAIALAGTVFNITGDAATINIDRFNLGPVGRETTLNFKFDATGVSPIVCGNYMRLNVATVNVDGSTYTGGPGVIPLLTSPNSGGISPLAATITAPFPGYDSAISLVGTNLVVTLSVPGVDWDGSDDMVWTGPLDTTSWSGGTYNDGDTAYFTDTGAGAVTIAGTVEPYLVSVNSTDDYSFSGDAIGGIGGLTKSGVGTLTLGSANTYTGVTTVSGGTLTVGDNAALGDTAGNTVVSGGSLRMEGGIALAEPLDISGGTGTAPALWNAAGSNTVSGAISGNGRIQSDAGTMTLSGGITSATNSILVGEFVVNSTPLTVPKMRFAGDSFALGDPSHVGGRKIMLNAVTGTHDWDYSLLFFDADVELGANDVMPTDAGVEFGWSQWRYSKARLDLKGFDQTVAYIGMASETTSSGWGGDIEITDSTGGSTLTVNQATNTEYQGRITGGISLVKDGSGTLNLNNLSSSTAPAVDTDPSPGPVIPNSYTGDTTVLDGTLVMNTADLADGSTVTLVGAGKLQLDHGALDTVAGLTLGGIPQGPGTYNAGNSLGFITGTGSIVVPGAGGNYSTWATANGIPGEPASGDFDNDGITNLVEYALGLNPTVSSQPAGVLSGNVITYTKGADAITNGDVSWVIETSETLASGSWTAQITQAAGDATSTIAHTLTPGSPVKEFARLKVVRN